MKKALIGVVVFIIIIASVSIPSLIFFRSRISNAPEGSNISNLTKSTVDTDISEWSGKKHSGTDYLGLKQGSDGALFFMDAQAGSVAKSYLNFDAKVGAVKFKVKFNNDGKIWTKFRSSGKVVFQLIESGKAFYFKIGESSTMYNLKITNKLSYSDIGINWDTLTKKVSVWCNGEDIVKDASFEVSGIIDSIMLESEYRNWVGHHIVFQFEYFNVWN